MASNTVLRAAPGNRVRIGDESNVQDNVTVRAYHDSITVGDKTSLTHHAAVEDSEVGDSVFVGYGSEIEDSEVGDGSFVYHGARVEGVEIPKKSFVGAGEVVTDQKTADALPKTGEVDLEKYYDTKEQIDTNKEFAESYIDLYKQKGYQAVVEVGPNRREDHPGDPRRHPRARGRRADQREGRALPARLAKDQGSVHLVLSRAKPGARRFGGR